MLDQLVESKSNLQNTKRRGSYLLTTSILVFSLFASGILWSLFAKNLEIGNDGLELSSIVAPVPMNEDTPPPPEPVKQVKQETTKVENSLPVRNENIAQIDENQPIPKEISTSPNTKQARPDGKFVVNPDAAETNGSMTGRSGNDDNASENNSKIVVKPREVENTDTEKEPPVIKKKVEPEVKKNPTTVTRSTLLNGQALSLPKPPYPAPAKAIKVGGDVNVQVTIDEQGNVISAKAVSGHPLLRQVSEGAARSAKFSPTILGGQPVKVTGLIVYKFSTQ